MRLTRKLALACLLFALSACATSPAVMTDRNLTTQIANLEHTEGQLRNQYNTIGLTLTKLEARITELKAQHEKNMASLPAPVAEAQAVKPTVMTPEKPEPPPAMDADEAKSDHPVSIIGGLTDQDMSIQSASTAPAPQPMAMAPSSSPQPATAAPAASGVRYIVHLASYLNEAPIKHGWQQLTAANSNLLNGLKPYLSKFDDSQHRHWLRLSAGPFTSHEKAEQRCASLKAAGTWCDVLQEDASNLRMLR